MVPTTYASIGRRPFHRLSDAIFITIFIFTGTAEKIVTYNRLLAKAATLSFAFCILGKISFFRRVAVLLCNFSTLHLPTSSCSLDEPPRVLWTLPQKDKYLGHVIVARLVHRGVRCGHHEGIQTGDGVGNVERFWIGLGQPLDVLKVEPLVVAGLVQRKSAPPILLQGRSGIRCDEGGQKVAGADESQHLPRLGREQSLRPGDHFELIQLPTGIVLAEAVQG
mmetsp:Transcript_33592/g.99005  ORF Transcript_33592/g.99005 Transcript_33592/m.99005 type:complete len:222 (-) Transcript_33592:796-1461(-)